MGLIKGDTRSLDYISHRTRKEIPLPYAAPLKKNEFELMLVWGSQLPSQGLGFRV